uniref:Uncharacterized protein n=1 Tax=Candidatus Methanophagaceae archaeon ANME-1 ERB6 TaxID=2759912 RepID=A0A7G9YV65_9EURY|nr:hypothetical protein PJPOCDLN_00005 [Methanosarcinales archaeon ANME-1 ERB6]
MKILDVEGKKSIGIEVKESGVKVYWDERVCEDAKVEDIDWEFVKNFFIPGYEKFSKKRIIGTPEELLGALSCIREGKPNKCRYFIIW